ncbi:L,D-transpeptidase [Pendulispora brunnea]|uniref:L,D-transpeptidase n=1 Tax=Pendulispora brunnea TaxID=2905690 RepID=A0ABZ2KFT8_9BACT
MMASASLVACAGTKDDAAPAPSSEEPAPAPAPPPVAEAADAGTALIGALYMQTPIMSEMAWQKEGGVRIGYVRQGQKVPVFAQPHPQENCKAGWYELVQGGFVCGKYASLDLNQPSFQKAGHPPDMQASMPYEYAYNLTNGTPLYRTPPSRETRLESEPWLLPKKEAPEDEAQVDTPDAGAPSDGGTPWYLRDYGGAKPQVTLDELRGGKGPIASRMVRGFFLSLDKDVTTDGGHWWKTQDGLYAPFERLVAYKPATDFHGIWLEGDGPTAVGVILSQKAKKYTVSANKKTVTAGASLPYHTVLRLTGASVTLDGARYDETSEGFWTKASEGTKTRAADPPKDLAPGEKWIDIDVTAQMLVAYEGDKPVFATAVSTGVIDKKDKTRDHHTVLGSFRVREKHISSTMDDDVPGVGPYSLQDVPWIMFFQGSYATHTAFWHNSFGRMRSHGCVNMAPQDAKALFMWSEPRLPEGWHGVLATAERPGTRIIVRE